MSEPRLGKEGGIVPRSDFIGESRIAFGEPFAGTGDGIRVEIIECGVRDARSFSRCPRDQRGAGFPVFRRLRGQSGQEWTGSPSCMRVR